MRSAVVVFDVGWASSRCLASLETRIQFLLFSQRFFAGPELGPTLARSLALNKLYLIPFSRKT